MIQNIHKAVREQLRDVTQVELARRIGVSQTIISQLSRGVRLGRRTRRKVVKYLEAANEKGKGSKGKKKRHEKGGAGE